MTDLVEISPDVSVIEIDIGAGEALVLDAGGAIRIDIVPVGDQGPAGPPPELQTAAGHVQWRAPGGAWVDLVPLAEITGPDGDPGPPGDPSPSRVFVQPDRPTQPGPWMWWRTGAGGTLLDLIINTGD